MGSPEPSGFIIFLLFVSFYWGIQVNKNISHTTTCGVAGMTILKNIYKISTTNI